MGQTRAVRTPQHRRRRRAMRRALREQAPHHHREAVRRRRDGAGTTGTSITATSGTRWADGHVEPDLEYAWHEGPWITVTTRTSHGLPEARVWSHADLPPLAWRNHIRNDPCCYCGAPTSYGRDTDRNDPRRGSVEHVLRKADGGRGLDENTVGACWGCNRTRGELDVLDMLLRERLHTTREDLA
jgi:hypothetical protein